MTPLPRTFDAALEALEADPLIADAMGDGARARSSG